MAEPKAKASPEQIAARRVLILGLRHIEPEVARGYKWNPLDIPAYETAHLMTMPSAMFQYGFFSREGGEFSINLAGQHISLEELNERLADEKIRELFFGNKELRFRIEKNGDLILQTPDGSGDLTEAGKYGNIFHSVNRFSHTVTMVADAIASEKLRDKNPAIEREINTALNAIPDGQEKPSPHIGEQIIKFRGLFGSNRKIAEALGMDISDPKKEWESVEDTKTLITAFNNLASTDKAKAEALLSKFWEEHNPPAEVPEVKEGSKINEDRRKNAIKFNEERAARLEQFKQTDISILINILKLGEESGHLDSYIKFSELENLSQFLMAGQVTPFLQLSPPLMDTSPWKNSTPPEFNLWLDALSTDRDTAVQRLVTIKNSLGQGIMTSDGLKQDINLDVITGAGNKTVNSLIETMNLDAGKTLDGFEMNSLTLGLYTAEVLKSAKLGYNGTTPEELAKYEEDLIRRIGETIANPSNNQLTENEQNALHANLRGEAVGAQQYPICLSLDDMRMIDHYFNRQTNEHNVTESRGRFIDVFGPMDTNQTTYHFWNSGNYTNKFDFSVEEKQLPMPKSRRDNAIAFMKENAKEFGFSEDDMNIPEGTITGRLNEKQTIALFGAMHGKDAAHQVRDDMQTIRDKVTPMQIALIGGPAQYQAQMHYQQTLEIRMASKIAEIDPAELTKTASLDPAATASMGAPGTST